MCVADAKSVWSWRKIVMQCRDFTSIEECIRIGMDVSETGLCDAFDHGCLMYMWIVWCKR